LNLDGSGLLWSTLLHDGHLNALAIDDAGNVYVTGRRAVVTALSDRGQRQSDVARFEGEGRAISITPNGDWIFVAGDTDAPFVVALRRGKTGEQRRRILAKTTTLSAPEIALTPALDAFAAAYSTP
jgi:hypothetical protein